MAREWLKALRLEKYPSQSALARAAGIAPARYSRLELGYSELRDDEVRSLSSALEATEEYILTGKRKRASSPRKKTATAREPEPKDNPAPPPTPKPVPSAVHPPEPPKGLAAAAAASAAPVVPPAPAEATPAATPIAQSPAAAPTSSGNDLSDPANFGLLPSEDVLKQGSLSPAEFRARLQQQAAFANKVLHTSKVKPRVWVAWRDFGREIERVLRGDNAAPAAAPAAAAESAPTPPPRPKVLPPVSKAAAPPPAPRPPAPTGARSKFNKNLFGHFVDVARELLRPEQLSEIEKLAAAAKEKEPETGFMKHFKRVAEANLPRAEYERIAAEAEQRTNPRPTSQV